MPKQKPMICNERDSAFFRSLVLASVAVPELTADQVVRYAVQVFKETICCEDHGAGEEVEEEEVDGEADDMEVEVEEAEPEEETNEEYDPKPHKPRKRQLTPLSVGDYARVIRSRHDGELLIEALESLGAWREDMTNDQAVRARRLMRRIREACGDGS